MVIILPICHRFINHTTDVLSSFPYSCKFSTPVGAIAFQYAKLLSDYSVYQFVHVGVLWENVLSNHHKLILAFMVGYSATAKERLTVNAQRWTQ